MYLRKRFDSEGRCIDFDTAKTIFEQNRCIDFKNFLDKLYSDNNDTE